MTKYDRVNEILCGQWRVNIIVSLVSVSPLLGEKMVTHCCGREFNNFICPSALSACNWFMNYFDLVDYNKKIRGGFTARPHFNKWYKRGFLVVVDFMMVNRQMTWNMSCDIPGIIHEKMNSCLWRVYMADVMLQWKDPHEISCDPPEDDKNLV